MAVLLLASAFLFPARSEAHRKAANTASSASAPRLTSDLSGTLPARDGDHLHLFTDLGNVIVHTQNSGKMDYRVHLETDATQKDSKDMLKGFDVTTHAVADGVLFKGRDLNRQSSGRLWVTIELNLPRNYSLDVSTGGGNIDADDVNGRVALSTAGGNITAGNIGGPAQLSTDGGHIVVRNVAGDLTAGTGGGHITAGAIDGDASLHTSGGHIRVSSVRGAARLETGGGNVTLEHSGADLIAETGGGQIDVGEADGMVRAKTGGGGIRLVRVSSPTELRAVDGSIYLTQVDSAVKASTGAGGITAWFVMPAKQSSECELESSDGDIVVYLPRHLPVTIDAQIQMGDQHHVIFDPAFPLSVSYSDASGGARMMRAVGDLNGGGEVLRLRTVAGNIRLLLSDSAKQLQIYNQQMSQLQQQLEPQHSADAPPKP